MATTLVNENMQSCITACWDCRTMCQKTLFQHCLPHGGKHAETEHVRAMIDCMAACQMAADFMMRGSASHRAACAACAEICYACADSCESFNDDEMRACVQLCRECAESCDDMSLNGVEESLMDTIESRVTLV